MELRLVPPKKPDKPDKTQIKVRIDAETAEKFRSLAEKEGTTHGALFESMLVRYQGGEVPDVLTTIERLVTEMHGKLSEVHQEAMESRSQRHKRTWLQKWFK